MELHELREQIAGREALERELESLHQKGNELNERLRREQLNLEYEQSDVEALESNTLKSLFYTAIGKKEELLMKEEDEAAEAKEQYEGTLKELEQVNARIKRIEIELRNLKWAERDYKKLVEDLSARVKELAPKMTDVDAIALEQVQRELAEQAQKQALYAQVTEEGEELKSCIAWVREALREAEEARQMEKSRQAFAGIRTGYSGAEYEDRMREAQERQQAVVVQAQRIQAIVNEGLNGGRGKPTVHNGTLPQDRLERLSINVAGNIGAILTEVEERTQNSKRYQAELESRLLELIEKYQTT